MNLTRVRELSLQIERLNKELAKEKELALETFRNMSDEDKVYCNNKMEQDGITIQYFPASTTKSLDSAKLKEDGIYDKYLKESPKSDFIKISVKPL